MEINELQHWGIKGMRWGHRRYQNKEGSLTPAGRKRYIDYNTGKLTKEGEKRLQKVGEDSNEGKHIRAERQEADIARHWVKSYNAASREFNKKIDGINKKFGDDADTNNKEYIREVGKVWTDLYSKELLKDFGPDVISNGKDWVNNMPMMDRYDESYWVREED